jgi:hypothetical protein
LKTYQTPDRPDPRIRIENVEELQNRYREMVQSGKGTLYFLIANETGMGRQATLREFYSCLQQEATVPFVFGGRVEDNLLYPWQPIDYHSATRNLLERLLNTASDTSAQDAIGNILALVSPALGPLSPIVGLLGQLLQTSASVQSYAQQVSDPAGQGAENKSNTPFAPAFVRTLLRNAAIARPVVCLLDRLDHFSPDWWATFFLTFAGEIQQTRILFVVTLDGDATLAVNPQNNQ